MEVLDPLEGQTNGQASALSEALPEHVPPAEPPPEEISGQDVDRLAEQAAAVESESESETEGTAEIVPRPLKSHAAPALIALERIDEDETFQLRPSGDLSPLATDIARLGQLFPVDVRLVPPDRFQIICGFRRVEALRFLQRDRVLARLHTDLSDEDALLLALASALHSVPVAKEELAALKERLESEGRMSAAARDMLDKALNPPSDTLAPEDVEQEVDADDLASDVTRRLGTINQDLSLLADVFSALDDERKRELIEQLRYSAELVAFLEER